MDQDNKMIARLWIQIEIAMQDSEAFPDIIFCRWWKLFSKDQSSKAWITFCALQIRLHLRWGAVKGHIYLAWELHYLVDKVLGEEAPPNPLLCWLVKLFNCSQIYFFRSPLWRLRCLRCIKLVSGHHCFFFQRATQSHLLGAIFSSHKILDQSLFKPFELHECLSVSAQSTYIYTVHDPK